MTADEARLAELRAEGWEEVTDPASYAMYALLGRRWNGPNTALLQALSDDLPSPCIDSERPSSGYDLRLLQRMLVEGR